MKSNIHVIFITFIYLLIGNVMSIADSSNKPNPASKSYEQTLKNFLVLAKQNDASAQIKLYIMYYNGIGTPINKKTALEWCNKAANNGNSDAQMALGLIYAKGEDVPQNYQTAFKWYLKAAQQGNISAQNNIGQLYINGWGVSTDYQEAMNWFLKAATQYDAIAQANIGLLYYKGLGVPKDYQKARIWLSKAANQGYANAQFVLGIMYGRGLGVEKNIPKSMNWLNKAARQGHKIAQETLEMNAISQKTHVKKQSPKITHIQTKGNLASTRSTGCVGIDTLTNREIPPNIYRGASDCIKMEQYDKAAKLIFLARFYGAFDGKRIADRTAAQGIRVLEMNMLSPVPMARKTNLQIYFTDHFNIGGVARSAFCRKITKMGYPVYHPDYLIQHGIAAFSKRKGNGLKPGFKASKTWGKILARGCKK
ncbi:MAG: sel1 repeat family protein [Emcibacter sp.]|nr:sel1 repeat family protein [Emcibacter sp.]